MGGGLRLLELLEKTRAFYRRSEVGEALSPLFRRLIRRHPFVHGPDRIDNPYRKIGLSDPVGGTLHVTLFLILAGDCYKNVF